MSEFFHVSERLQRVADEAESKLQDNFARIDQLEAYNTEKVLRAFIDHKVSESHFCGSTGYGYDDRGRETLDAVYAQIFGTQDALVRHQIVSGTHALTVALFGILRPGDCMLSLTGKPYDTMEEVIGLRGEGSGSLLDFGVTYRQMELVDGKRVDFARLAEKASGVRLAYIQRSRGYASRPALTVKEIKKAAREIHRASPNTVVLVDNCYGEFVEEQEPTQVGADLAVGSLIKNAGGGIAQTGGYLAGRRDLIELCACRLTAPGVGKEVGCTLDQSRSMYLGLFFAPTVTANALKVSAFSREFFSLLGFETYPQKGEPVGDIITALKLGSKEALIAFCHGIQSASPVDSFVQPQPWDMPGYDAPVIMAAGAFTSGASIELSADAPLKEPYFVYLQGGLTYPSGKAGVLLAAEKMCQAGLIQA